MNVLKEKPYLSVRAKSIKTGLWIYGYYTYDYKNGHRIDDSRARGRIEIDVNTLSSFTGEYDIFETPIYEGHLLNSQNDGKDGCDKWTLNDYQDIVVKIEMNDIAEPGTTNVQSFERLQIVGDNYENDISLKEALAEIKRLKTIISLSNARCI